MNKKFLLEPGAQFSIKWGHSVRAIVEVLETSPRKVSYTFRGLDPKYAHLSRYYLLTGEQIYNTFRKPFMLWLKEKKAKPVKEQKRKYRMTKRRIKHLIEEGEKP